MCEPTSITMGVMTAASLAGSAMSARDKAKQAGLAEDQQRRQKIEIIKSTNIQDANLDLQDKQNISDTIASMSNNNLQAIKNQGLVRAAIGESGLSGHSMERIQRDVQGQSVRANAGLKENYERDYEKLYKEKEANKANSNAQINGMAPVQMPDATAEAVGGILNAGSTAFNTYQGAKTGGISGAVAQGFNSLNRQENK